MVAYFSHFLLLILFLFCIRLMEFIPYLFLQRSFSPSRYSLGDRPTKRLKYFPKNDCEGKFSSCAICCTVKVEDFSSTLASITTKSFIQSEGDFPLTRCTRVER